MSYLIEAGLPDIATLNAHTENYAYSYNYNDTDPEYMAIMEDTIYSLSIIISIFGVVGNGIVLWLLGFQIKRNQFTIYILNLAAADFGVLVLLDLLTINTFSPLGLSETHDFLFFTLFISTYCTSQFLLTTISMDRCVAVLFPIWHRCHRPPHLSAIVSAFIWVFTFLPFGIQIFVFIARGIKMYYVMVSFFINTLFCLPLMIISSVILFIKACLKPKQRKRKKFLTIILLALFCFLILSFPLTLVGMMNVFGYLSYSYCFPVLFSCINSSINPLIYFLVGSRKKDQSRQGLKAIFQKIFKEDRE